MRRPSSASSISRLKENRSAARAAKPKPAPGGPVERDGHGHGHGHGHGPVPQVDAWSEYDQSGARGGGGAPRVSSARSAPPDLERSIPPRPQPLSARLPTTVYQPRTRTTDGGPSVLGAGGLPGPGPSVGRPPRAPASDPQQPPSTHPVTRAPPGGPPRDRSIHPRSERRDGRLTAGQQGGRSAVEPPDHSSRLHDDGREDGRSAHSQDPYSSDPWEEDRTDLGTSEGTYDDDDDDDDDDDEGEDGEMFEGEDEEEDDLDDDGFEERGAMHVAVDAGTSAATDHADGSPRIFDPPPPPRPPRPPGAPPGIGSQPDCGWQDGPRHASGREGVPRSPSPSQVGADGGYPGRGDGTGGHRARPSLVSLDEVTEIIAAAAAGERPPPPPSSGPGSGGMKGAAAAAIAHLSERVRRAVSDARREGAALGAGETRQAMQRAAGKMASAEKAAAAVVRTAEERQRAAEERQRAAEEALAGKSRAMASQLKQVKEDLQGKNRLLKARAESATNEAAALRAELRRERERAEAAEKAEAGHKQGDARLKALLAEARRGREDALAARAAEAAQHAEERRVWTAAVEHLDAALRDALTEGEAAVAAMKREATREAEAAVAEVRVLRADFDGARDLVDAAVTAHRRRVDALRGELSRTRDAHERQALDLDRARAEAEARRAAEADAEKCRDREAAAAAELAGRERAEKEEAEARAAALERRVADAEEGRAAAEREAADAKRAAARAEALRVAEREEAAEAARCARNAAKKTEDGWEAEAAAARAAAARAAEEAALNAASARQAKGLAAEAAGKAEAARAALEKARAEAAEDARLERERRAAAEEARAEGAYQAVHSELRALRRRYFRRAGHRGEDRENRGRPTEGADAGGGEGRGGGGESSDDESGGASAGMGRVERRLDPQGLVAAMLSFTRASTVIDGDGPAGHGANATPSAAAAADARRELHLMEECLLLMLAGDLGPPSVAGGAPADVIGHARAGGRKDPDALPAAAAQAAGPGSAGPSGGGGAPVDHGQVVGETPAAGGGAATARGDGSSRNADVAATDDDNRHSRDRRESAAGARGHPGTNSTPASGPRAGSGPACATACDSPAPVTPPPPPPPLGGARHPNPRPGPLGPNLYPVDEKKSAVPEGVTGAMMGPELSESPIGFGGKHVRPTPPRQNIPPQPQPYPTVVNQPEPQPQYPARGADHLRATLGRVCTPMAENRGAARSMGGKSFISIGRAGAGTASGPARKGLMVGGGPRRAGSERGSSVYAPSLVKDGNSSRQYGHAPAELAARERRRDDVSTLTASDNDILDLLTAVARGGEVVKGPRQ